MELDFCQLFCDLRCVGNFCFEKVTRVKWKFIFHRPSKESSRTFHRKHLSCMCQEFGVHNNFSHHQPVTTVPSNIFSSSLLVGLFSFRFYFWFILLIFLFSYNYYCFFFFSWVSNDCCTKSLANRTPPKFAKFLDPPEKKFQKQSWEFQTFSNRVQTFQNRKHKLTCTLKVKPSRTPRWLGHSKTPCATPEWVHPDFLALSEQFLPLVTCHPSFDLSSRTHSRKKSVNCSDALGMLPCRNVYETIYCLFVLISTIDSTLWFSSASLHLMNQWWYGGYFCRCQQNIYTACENAEKDKCT